MEQQKLFQEKECHHGLPLKEVCYDCERENAGEESLAEEKNKPVMTVCSCEVCEYYRTKE